MADLHALEPPAPPAPPESIRALTLDLDDTLWPIAPVIRRAEAVLHDWLLMHAPATAKRYPVEAMRTLRAEIGRCHPEFAHDLTELRLRATRHALIDSGDDPALALPAFELFFAERQKVVFFPEVEAALERLSARWPLLALTNGNADLATTGLDRWLCGSVGAREAGVAKPNPRIFQAACERLQLPPESVLHIGDDWQLDIAGAQAAGLHSAWICRDSTYEPADRSQAHPQVPRFANLLALTDWLGA